MESLSRQDIDKWLEDLYLPEDGGSPRERAVAEMREAGIEHVFPQLSERLKSPDAEIRCRAIGAMVLLDAQKAVPFVVGCLSDPEAVVRWQACGCLGEFGDDRAVDALVEVTRSDSEAQVRGTAAAALGALGSPAAIPALLVTMASDKEVDERGFTPSWYAAMALDDILGTDETRIKTSEGLCRLPDGQPDLDLLRRQAKELYERWSSNHE